MKIFSVTIENFRGIRSTKLVLPDHAVLIGDNNTGKSSVLEAIDLALGPDRLSRRPPVDEHDFYQGKYLAVESAQAPEGAAPAAKPKITVEVTITALSPEQQARFGANVEWLYEHRAILRRGESRRCGRCRDQSGASDHIYWRVRF
ncbi:ATP-dependent nuclease [Bradyrhizobium rifense]|uniref:ATP-dependent nuclease n=1 Tax=Bradyrhizobium rifense TaxID=515499 RepID=UPI001FEA05AB|nr:AAA family ATPase [Bradyrhizobium rifense]